jgi:hypothetical protein
LLLIRLRDVDREGVGPAAFGQHACPGDLWPCTATEIWRSLVLMDDVVWTVEVLFRERDGRTRADAILVTERGRFHGWGRAKLAPRDEDVPAVGEELAAARALSDLANKLLHAAADEIERRTGERALLS